MAKKVKGVVKLQIPAGAANPAPPVGPALGSAGVNIMQFCKEFNAKTAKQAGLVIPVIITVYQDRSFSLEFKSPPASVLLKKEADENGDDLFITLDDEDEFEKVANYFDSLFDSEVDYDA